MTRCNFAKGTLWCRTSSCRVSPHEPPDHTPPLCCWSGRVPDVDQKLSFVSNLIFHNSGASPGETAMFCQFVLQVKSKRGRVPIIWYICTSSQEQQFTFLGSPSLNAITATATQPPWEKKCKPRRTTMDDFVERCSLRRMIMSRLTKWGKRKSYATYNIGAQTPGWYHQMAPRCYNQQMMIPGRIGRVQGRRYLYKIIPDDTDYCQMIPYII